MSGIRLDRHPVHLGLGAVAAVQPEFTGDMDWYGAYSARTAEDGRDGRLVTIHDFDADWDSWEMHPEGDEVVVCLSGTIKLHQQMPDAAQQTVSLRPGEYAINPAAVWHTADVPGAASVLFITAGLGTQHRPR